jgi:hypothetical protein
MTYTIEQIEVAFFNFDEDGSETTQEHWENRRKEWALFKADLDRRRLNDVSPETPCSTQLFEEDRTSGL